MNTQLSPVVRHRNWRFLLRDFSSTYRRIGAAVPADLLSLLLTPAACVAWWIVNFHPDLLDRQTLHVVVAGAGNIEARDEGRWFAFLPWLLGRPEMHVQVTLVGDQLVLQQSEGLTSSCGMSMAALRRALRSRAASVVSDRQPAEIFNGLLRHWRGSSPQEANAADAFVIFAPGMEAHHASWMTPADIVPLLLRNAPMALFPYSRADGNCDLHFFRLYGIRFASEVLTLCPWHFGDEQKARVGAFGHYCIDLRVREVPAEIVIDEDRVLEYQDAIAYLMPEISLLGDIAIDGLGGRTDVRGEAIISLPSGHAVIESNGEAGHWEEPARFVPFEPPIVVPQAVLHARPQTGSDVERMLWAVRTHREHVGPELNARSGEPSI